MATAIDSITRRRRLFVLVLIISIFFFMPDYKITSQISMVYQDTLLLADPLQQFHGYGKCGVNLTS